MLHIKINNAEITKAFQHNTTEKISTKITKLKQKVLRVYTAANLFYFLLYFELTLLNFYFILNLFGFIINGVHVCLIFHVFYKNFICCSSLRS